MKIMLRMKIWTGPGCSINTLLYISCDVMILISIPSSMPMKTNSLDVFIYRNRFNISLWNYFINKFIYLFLQLVFPFFFVSSFFFYLFICYSLLLLLLFCIPFSSILMLYSGRCLWLTFRHFRVKLTFYICQEGAFDTQIPRECDALAGFPFGCPAFFHSFPSFPILLFLLYLHRCFVLRILWM